ncbi:MAG TPA: hypothetical protein VHC91_08855 [Trinickia sp.]|uniref:hypothetical protein n=1 Tax=Trinickia sp. TaxID=2571163 RepID=UPI002C2BD53E|nr:hypothetical protein [Trinickia sp.]HVW50498.1 hypothetical protein [Trinickia sp.]
MKMSIRKTDSQALDALRFDEVLLRLRRGVGDIVVEGTTSIPEADVMLCRYKGKRFNIKFDLDYGVCIEAIDGLSGEDLRDLVRLLTR